MYKQNSAQFTAIQIPGEHPNNWITDFVKIQVNR